MSGTTTPLLSDPSTLQPKASDTSSLYLHEILHKLASFSAPLSRKALDSYDKSEDNFPEAQNWIFANESYQTWLNSSESTILNLYGSQGRGKTFISNAVYHSLRLQDVPLAYASCDTNDGLGIPISKIFAVVLHQILTQRPVYLSCLQSISPSVPAEPPSEESIYEYFRNILALRPDGLEETALTIMIDGFDSCKFEQGYPILRDMISAAAPGSPSTIRIFLTSDKPIPELSHFLSIDLSKQPAVQDNIRCMVKRGISSMVKQSRIADELQDKIAGILVNRVQGKEVLTVKFLLQEMEYSRIPSASALIHKQIKTLPGCMSELFFFQLERIHEHCREWCAKVLHWLLLAVRRMTLEELKIALALSMKGEPGMESIIDKEYLSLSLRDDINSILGGLVEINGPYVRLIHPALGRYLIAKDDPIITKEEANTSRNPNLVSPRLSNSASIASMPNKSDHETQRLDTDSSNDTDPTDSDFESSKSASEGAPDRQNKELKTASALDIYKPLNGREWYKIKDIGDAHKEIAQFCVTFLAVDAKGHLEEGVDSPYGWDYALDAWTEHFSKGIPHAEVSFKHSSNHRNPFFLLLAAVQLGCSDAVQQLLKHITVKEAIKGEPKEYWILHLAASCGYKEVVEVLLRSNLFSCDELNMNDQYPLHLASIKGHEEVVKLLLNEHSTANKQNGEGYTALQLAAMRGHEGVVRQLVETQQTRQRENRACKKALSSVVVDQPDSDSDSENDWDESSSSDSDFADFIDNSNRKPPPLHLAAKAGHGEIVRLLAQLNKEDVNATFGEEGTPLHCAVISQKPEVVETLIGLHVDLDKKRFSGWGALHLACREKLTTIIKQLIDAGANINLPTSNGSPPLSVAAQEGHFEGVQLLLDAGADPNQCNIRGVGPLYRAIFCRSVECVDALLNAGADPFKEASYISTPYKLALDLEGDIANSLKRHTQGLLASKASSGDVSGLRRLLDYEVDINGQDECGRTALFWASACGHREIIKVLHKYKAKHTIQDKDDLTCFDTATSDPMTLDLLRDLFLGLSKDTLLEDGGEYNCNYHERQGYRISSLRCNICREGRMNGYFFHCCTCGCTPESESFGYDICESCYKKDLFCHEEHKRRYFKGIIRREGFGYKSIVAMWRSYDWESGNQSSYLYSAKKIQEVDAREELREGILEGVGEDTGEGTREESGAGTRKETTPAQ